LDTYICTTPLLFPPPPLPPRDFAREGESLEHFAYHASDTVLDGILGTCDVLLLCHGVKSDDMAECVKGNCTSQLALIERYLRCREAMRKPNDVMHPEVC
jgi:hypothetical protein